jgi:hypothetical protein
MSQVIARAALWNTKKQVYNFKPGASSVGVHPGGSVSRRANTRRPIDEQRRRLRERHSSFNGRRNERI